MNFDLSMLLFVLTIVSGGVWAIDAMYFAPRRQRIKNNREPIVVNYARSFFPVFLVVFLIRSFAFEPFRIPSGSMLPTLHVGDFILVKKYDYGIRLPIIHTKILDFGSPQRGDVIVFRYPPNEQLHYIKRVIGLPGDEITYKNKTVYINGVAMPQTDKASYLGAGGQKMLPGISLRTEILENIEHDILIDPRFLSNTSTAIVPEGHYFVLGDNRDHSVDSRMWKFVPDKNLLGRAVVIWMNWNSKKNEFNFARSFTSIQ